MKASWFRTSGGYTVHARTWLVASTQTMPLHMDPQCTLARSGEMEFAISHSQSFCSLRANGEWKRSFSWQLETLDVCISFILPASGKQDASLRCRRYAVEAKLQLSWLKNPLSTPLRRKSTRTQAQLHTLVIEIGSTYLVASAVFPNHTPCPPSGMHPSKPRVVVRGSSSCTIDDMATGRPRP